ncbi:MAG: flagellar basal body-associated protein FliL [Herminiimonas sp.]|nr:flagellar basal body-associated protein FliL [Herminiimonas sp.]
MATSGPKSVPKAAPKAEAEDDAPVAKKSSKKLIIIILLVVLLAGGGGAAWFFMGQKESAGAKHAKVEAVKPPVFLVVEPFTVNLQSEGTEQFLQAAFTLQVGSAEQVDQLKLYMPQVRSRLLLLLTSKKASEINTAEGKKKLSNEIMAAVKQPFSAGAKPQEINDVFFTSFVIQ